MSYASDLKSELCGIKLQGPHRKKARAYGLLLFSKSFGADSISMITEHEETALHYEALIKGQQAVLQEPEVTVRKLSAKRSSYSVSVPQARDRLLLLEDFGADPARPYSINRALLKKAGCLSAFISGAYLACGSVSDPAKDYHLEFVIQHRELLDELESLLDFVSPKTAVRRGSHILYFKESEQIEDIMTFMGATKSALRLMDVKIIKDVRNKINRQTNCETANIEKTVSASMNQIRDIRLIFDEMGEESLPEELRCVARMRLENPDMSLRDLGEAIRPPLSRSGVNHRLRRIADIAASIRKE